MNFNFKSKIDGCSLKRIGVLPFRISDGFKCIGVQAYYESTDKILLVDKSFEDKNGTRYSVMYVLCLTTCNFISILNDIEQHCSFGLSNHVA